MDLERIEAVIRLAVEAGLSELVVETEGWRVGVKTGGARVVAGAPTEIPAAIPEEPALVPVRSRMVGIFRPASPTVEVGSPVAGGQTIGHIESMRILNPVAAEQAGSVAEVLVEDGDPVEYGQVLFTLTPLPAEESPAES